MISELKSVTGLQLKFSAQLSLGPFSSASICCRIMIIFGGYVKKNFGGMLVFSRDKVNTMKKSVSCVLNKKLPPLLVYF